MKKNLYISLCLIVASISANAQLNVTLTDQGGIVQNEQTYYEYGFQNTSTMDVGMYAVNNSAATMSVNLKRYETSVQPLTKNFFCWGLCYGEVDAGSIPVWISDDEVSMDPTISYNNFHAYHRPQGQVGVSCYRYVWFDVNNTNDSTWVDICFDTQSVGVDENVLISDLNVYPNPSTGSVNFELALKAQPVASRLLIHNLLGEQVWSRNIVSQESKIILNEGLLTPGIYFYTIESDGTALATEKLIIADR